MSHSHSSMSARLAAFSVCLAAACFAAATALASSAETSGKGKTKVSIYFSQSQLTLAFRYTTKIKKPRRCLKRRRVTVFHDQNENGKLDKNEYVIGTGVTKPNGVFQLVSSTAPPHGDRIGVIVNKNSKCKGAKASTIVGVS